MIRQEINVNVNDVTMTGEITVPSPVIAITSQEETYDLTERKNFSIKLKDTDGVIVLEDGSSYINVDFEFGGKIYNADMSIYNRSINGDVTLQYASGLTAEDVSDDSSDDSSDETTLDKYLDVECSLSSNSKSMALPQGNNNNLQTYVYAAVYLVDPNTVVGAGTDWEHYYTQVVVTQHTLDMIGGESLGGWGWWGTKKYDDYLVVSDSSSVYALDENGNELGNFTEDVDRVGIWRFDQLGGMQATIFDVHGMKLVVGNDEVYTKTFDLATPYIRVMRNGSQDNSGTFYGTVDKNANETVWSDYLIYPVYDDMYGGIWNASNGSDFLGQLGNGGAIVGQYVSGDPHGYPFMNNLGAYGLNPSAFEGQDPQVLIEWRRSNPSNAPEYNEDTVNQYPYKVLYSHTYQFFLESDAPALDNYTLSSAPSSYSDIGAYYDSVVYSNESNDVYMTSVGMTYDTDHYLFDASNQTGYSLRFWAPSNNTIDKITFVGLNEPYASALLQQGTVGHGTISTDGNGNTIWTRTQDYDTYEGLEEFNFTSIIDMHGTSMTCNEIIVSLNPNYIPPKMKITFTTSKGTYQVWNNFTAGGGYGETVMYDLASDTQGSDMIHGTWKYYIDDVEQDSNEYSIQSDGNRPFNDGGIYINIATDNDGNVHSATGDIGYWGAQYYVTLDSNVTINYQKATV